MKGRVEGVAGGGRQCLFCFKIGNFDADWRTQKKMMKFSVGGIEREGGGGGGCFYSSLLSFFDILFVLKVNFVEHSRSNNDTLCTHAGKEK